MVQRASFSSCVRGRVAVVYGSFCTHRESQMDADLIRRALVAEGLEVEEPREGCADAWEAVARRVEGVVVCTSTRLGLPPENLAPFADALVGAAADAGAPPLGHLKHAVFGNGHENWLSTFMGAPRNVDALLERCGSTRVFARGEANEPCAPLDVDRCRIRDWAPACAKAFARALGNAGAPEVAHEALWAKMPSPFHHDFQPWTKNHLRAFYPDLDPNYAPPMDDLERQLRRRVARRVRAQIHPK